MALQCKSNRSIAPGSGPTSPDTRSAPVETHEKIVIGSPVPRDAELATVPSDWGPSLTKYRHVYSGRHVMLVDPETRMVMVVQEVD